MMKTFVTTFAAATLLAGSTLAFAQDAVKPLDPAATNDGTTIVPPVNTTDMGEVGATYLTQQGLDQVSAKTYIGQTVYNAANEGVGEINDLIVAKNGGIVAAVIGVGGFLGIGEKWVAVPMANITVSQATDGGQMKLMTTETADSLKAAPEFKTLAVQAQTKS
jgi:PRC-barrel domain